MKSLLVGLSLAMSVGAFANCAETVEKNYVEMMSKKGHDYIYTQYKTLSIAAGEKTVDLGYGVKESFNFDKDMVVFYGASEFEAGFGVDALVVDAETCSIAEVINVYTE